MRKFVSILFSLTVIFALAKCSSSNYNPSNPTVIDKGNVLLVGTYKGVRGAFNSIQSAIDAAKTGDYILVAPGVYHETSEPGTALTINKPDIHIEGIGTGIVTISAINVSNQNCSTYESCQLLSKQSCQSSFSAGIENEIVGINFTNAQGSSVKNINLCDFAVSTNSDVSAGIIVGGDNSKMNSKSPIIISNVGIFNQGPLFQDFGVFIQGYNGVVDLTNVSVSSSAVAGIDVRDCTQCDVRISGAKLTYNVVGVDFLNTVGEIGLIGSNVYENSVGVWLRTTQIQGNYGRENGRCYKTSQNCILINENSIHDNGFILPTYSQNAIENVPIGGGIVIAGGVSNDVLSNQVFNNQTYGIAVYDFVDSNLYGFNNVCAGQEITAAMCLYKTANNLIANNLLYGNAKLSNSFYDLAEFSQDQSAINCFQGNISKVNSRLKSNLNQVKDGCSYAENNFDSTQTFSMMCLINIFGGCSQSNFAFFISQLKLLIASLGYDPSTVDKFADPNFNFPTPSIASDYSFSTANSKFCFNYARLPWC